MGKPGGGNGKAPAPEPLAPHPLVIGLAASLFGNKTVRQAYEIAEAAKDAKFVDGDADQVFGGDAAVAAAVKKFVNTSTRWELVKFAGYLGDAITVPDNPDDDGPWQVLFLDETADSYLGVRVKDILFRDRIADDKAAFGELDVVWVRAEARMLTGGRMETLLGRYTSGGFMRAGDFRSSMSGGTLSSVSDLGPLCTAFTPCCCNRHSP